MRKIEIISGLVVLIGLIMRLNFIPGGSLFLLLALTTLGFIYNILGFAIFNGIGLRQIFKKESYKGLTPLKIFGAIGVGWVLSSTCMGILYKILQWSDAENILITGLVLTLILLIIALMRFVKNKAPFYKRILKRIALIGGFGLILSFVSDLTLVKIEFRNHPRYIEVFKEYQDNPEDDELRKKMVIEYHRATLTDEAFKLYLKSYNMTENE